MCPVCIAKSVSAVTGLVYAFYDTKTDSSRLKYLLTSDKQERTAYSRVRTIISGFYDFYLKTKLLVTTTFDLKYWDLVFFSQILIDVFRAVSGWIHKKFKTSGKKTNLQMHHVHTSNCGC